jgi:DHA3 family macrolide efflux protein-like MFS transporter
MSICAVALPAMVLSRPEGGTVALGMVNTATGVSTLVGSILATAFPKPKSRVRVILNSLLFSMSTENFFLAVSRSAPLWCLGTVLGWLFIPLMGTNMDVLFRSKIPIDMQGRVYSARNTLQFFTIPLGYFLGGFLVDRVFEPLMAAQQPGSWWIAIFGTGKGSGAAMLFFILGVVGMLSCLPPRADKKRFFVSTLDESKAAFIFIDCVVPRLKTTASYAIIILRERSSPSALPKPLIKLMTSASSRVISFFSAFKQ